MTERRHLRIAVAFALLAIVLRAPAILYPVLGEEEAAEAGVAAIVAAGGELYRDAAAPEAPLGYWLTAAIYGVFGELAQRAVHVVALLAMLATMAVLAFAARALGGDRAAALAALFFAIFTVAQPPEALGANAELWMALLLAVAAWLVLGAAPTRRYGVLFAAGALAAVGALFRHAGHALAPAALAYFLGWRPALLGRAELATGARASISFVLGYGITYAVALGYLQDRGTLGELGRWAWSVGDSSSGATIVLHVGIVILGPLLLWFMAAQDVARTFRGWRSGAPRGEDDAAAAFALSWLITALAAALLRGRAGAGDFLPLLSPLVLLAARGSAAIADDFWEGKLARVFRLGVAIPAAAFFCASLFHEPLYRSLGIPRIRVRHIAEVVRAGSQPTDRLWVLGDARRVYVYARRVPAAKMVHAAGPTAEVPPEVREKPPAYVVDAGGARSSFVDAWLAQHYAVQREIEGVRILHRRRP